MSKPIEASPATRRLAALVAGASALQVAESLLPHPLPGLRLGLANVMTLVALVYLGPEAAVRLALARCVVASLWMGTFLSPGFLLSLGGAVASAAVMAGLYQWSQRFPRAGLSILGLSVAGAAVHMLAQLAIAGWLFVPGGGVAALAPLLLLGAAAAGLLVGLVALAAARRIDEGEGSAGYRLPIADGNVEKPAGRLPAGPALLGATVAAAAVAVTGRWPVLVAAAALALVGAGLGRVRAIEVLRRVARLWPLGLAAFLSAVLFTDWGRPALSLGPLRVTFEGLGVGGRYAARVLVLQLVAVVLNLGTGPDRLAVALGRALSPLRLVGADPGELAQLVRLSWSYFESCWAGARRMVQLGRAADESSRRGVGRLLRLPGELVAGMFRAAEEVA